MLLTTSTPVHVTETVWYDLGVNWTTTQISAAPALIQVSGFPTTLETTSVAAKL